VPIQITVWPSCGPTPVLVTDSPASEVRGAGLHILGAGDVFFETARFKLKVSVSFGERSERTAHALNIVNALRGANPITMRLGQRDPLDDMSLLKPAVGPCA
jgi:hypothetical protein